MTIEDQIAELGRKVDEFSMSVAALDEDLFLSKLNGWTPRDIVAHLVGWNSYIVLGAKQIVRGELPFYDIDPGLNYSTVNATLVREYDDTDRTVLLERLNESARELMAFLRTITPDVWKRDFGVRHQGENLSVLGSAGDVVTIKSTVDELVADYDHHRKQLEDFHSSSI